MPSSYQPRELYTQGDAKAMERGFILQSRWRMARRQPIIELFGRLENGATFLVREEREIPNFHIAARDLPRAQALGIAARETQSTLTLDGQPTARVELPSPAAARDLRDRLHQQSIATFEADLRFDMSYLIRLGVRGSLQIDGAWQDADNEPGVDRFYFQPKLTPAEAQPALSLLSFDIETDPKAQRLLSIGLCGCGAEEVFLYCPQGYDAPNGAMPFTSEAELLSAFCARVRELDPDILTGWNVIDFDLRVLDRLARTFGLTLDLGRGSRPGIHLRSTRSPWGHLEATIPGRIVLDGPRLLRGSFIKMDRYGLDKVARQVLGRGKTLTGGNRAEQIIQNFLHDRPRFVEYNLTDAQLVLDIFDKLQLIDLTIERSRLTGLPLDRVQGSIAAFDFLYLSALKRRRIVAPSVRQEGAGGTNLGGYVMEPEPGLHRYVLVFDFKSLYPSLIRTFQIDPLGFVPNPKPGEDLIRAPNRAAFRRQPGILTRMLDELFPRREAAKRVGDKVKSHAIKILMNSFYGVLGTPACRFYRPELASAITSFGREILLWSRDNIEKAYGYRVLYGDTDSLFVLSGSDSEPDAMKVAEDLCEQLNRDLTAHLETTWQVKSRLELEFETLYHRLLLLSTRHGSAGARKRYAGWVEEGGEGRVVFTGMESVRRDWTDLAKTIQLELYERLFTDRGVETYLRQTVRDLRRGAFDDQLIYRKALRKPLDAYTATTPPHVAAARKMSRPPKRLVSYVMTRQGPEPASERHSPIDHEHYVQKQVRPVAEPVLSVLGLRFDDIAEEFVQLRLFD